MLVIWSNRLPFVASNSRLTENPLKQIDTYVSLMRVWNPDANLAANHERVS
jgi:16S rRNA G527 N7-methylase RsmG